MELHRLDGLPTTGLDNLDIQDIDYELIDENLYTIGSLQTLEGLGTIDNTEITHEVLDENGAVVMYADANENLYMINGLEGFFKKIGKGLKKASKFVKKAVVKPVSKAVKFVGKKVLKPAFKFANRYLNPVTILLRNGFLLAMKVNMFKVASRLRYGYLSDTEASKRGINMSSFSKLKSIVRKAEKIYEGAGGKGSNLRKAILSGKGNSDKSVPLSGFELGTFSEQENQYTDDFERFVVGGDVEIIEEFMNAEEGVVIEGLGAVATGTAVAAASGAVASVSALLAKITGVFDNANKAKNQVTELVKNPFKSSSSSTIRPKATLTRTTNFVPNSAMTSYGMQNAYNPQFTSTTVAQESFLTKHKTPLLIGAGIIAVGGIAYAVTRKNKPAQTKPMSGVPKAKKQRDELGRFLSESANNKTIRPKKRKTTKKALPKKFVPKVLL